MTRPYSEAYLRELFSEEKVGVGYELARTCITANIPAKYVALALDVTPLTVFKWFHGSKISIERHERVYAFISLLKKDMDKGRLPAKNLIAAKLYIHEMLGGSVEV